MSDATNEPYNHNDSLFKAVMFFLNAKQFVLAENKANLPQVLRNGPQPGQDP